MARFGAFDISIHALRKESDIHADAGLGRVDISIHALRKESDELHTPAQSERSDFNPRSP